MAADLAFERTDRIDMRAWAGRAQIGYTFAEHRWKPTFTVGYQTFSGDDPEDDQEMILGRNVLNKLIVLLDGPRLRSEVLQRRPLKF